METTPYIIQSLSILLQFSAAFLALRLIRITGNIMAWTFIATAIILMVSRRCLTLYEWLSNGLPLGAIEITYEIIGLVISLFMVLGIALIGPVFLDIKQSAKRIRQSEENYKFLVNNIPAMVFKGYADWSVDFYDDKIEGATGYSRADFELRRLKWSDILLEQDVDPAQQVFLQALKTGEPYVREYRVRDQAGRILWIQERSHIVLNKDGQIDFITGVFFDITSHKQLEEALQENEERFRLMAERSIDIIYQSDLRCTVRYCSPAVYRFGYSPEELLGKTFTDYLPPSEIEKARQAMKRAAAGQNVELLELQGRKKDGTPLYLEVNAFPILKEGQVAGIQGLVRDITLRKKDEDSLRVSETRYRRLFETAKDGILLLDAATGAITDANPFILELLGYAKEEVWGKHLWDFGLASDMENWKKALEDLQHQEYLHDENLPLQTKSGKAIEVEFISNVYMIDHERVIQCNIRDISERRRAEKEWVKLEAQLRQAQKMEAIGTLAGGIAHDFNNILSIILGYTEMTLLSLEEASPLRNDLEQVMRAGHRAEDLVQQILAFSRKGEQELRPLRISLIIKEALKMLRASIPTTIDIRTNIQGLGTVLADATQIHQVLMNLCTNAAYAMRDEGGILEVSLADLELQQSLPHPDLLPGGYIKLSISDNGQGMAPEVMARIFDPFFTTKALGVGTGLGLSVVHGIVKNLHGAVTVYSEPGKGSTFNVYLPRIEDQGPLETKEIAPLPTGKECILFVDDEEALVELGHRMLEVLGYEVVARNSSLEALKTFQAQPEKFDLIITDQTMPQMTGIELAKKISSIRSDLPIMLCTGFSEIITAERAKDLGIKDFIMKPMVIADLARRVRHVLDDSRKK
jgi:PAS domain S-box-containing protein